MRPTAAALSAALEVIDRAQAELQDLTLRLAELRELVQDAQESLEIATRGESEHRSGEPASEPAPAAVTSTEASAASQRRKGRCYVVVRHPESNLCGLYRNYTAYCQTVADPAVTWSGRGAIPFVSGSYSRAFWSIEEGEAFHRQETGEELVPQRS